LVSPVVGIPFKSAAQYVGCSVGYLRKAANEPNQFRRLKTFRVGRKYFVTKENLTNWINRN
jgi:hypothetical protein